ncbi:MAG: DinB family protein [Patescibacteria group bacterium]
MTSKELFLKTVEGEQAIFIRVLKAVNQKKWGHKPHPRSRTGQGLVSLMADESLMLAKIISKGVVDFGKSSAEPKPVKTLTKAVKDFEKGFNEVKKAVKKVSEKDWEKADALMKGSFGEWKDKKGNMAWGFLFDLIHHRGQLSTYLRPMGGKVPSIYGPSADSSQ